MFLATVLGFSVLILICVAFFIYYLMVGLNSRTSVIVDEAPANPIPGHNPGLDR